MKSCYISTHFHTTSKLCCLYSIICRDFSNLFLVDRLLALFEQEGVGRDEGIDVKMNVLEERMTILSNYSLELGIILEVSDYIY